MIQFASFAEAHLDNAWATIGMFDGVHRGHQAILTPLVEQAHAAGDPAAVVTFFPHPVEVLRGVSGPLYLTTPDERARLIGQLGFEAVITLTFDRALAGLTAEAFMQQMSAALGLRQLWVGSDFALGRNRQGDLPTLRALGEKLGYALNVIPDVRNGNGGIPAGGMNASGSGASGGNNAGGNGVSERISSSLIREALRQGRASAAARMLGRPYTIEGPVMHGDRRGRTLGFPTANIGYWPGKIIPAYGVYATWTWVGGQRFASVTSVGVRPTFHQDQPTPLVESFLMDFDRDIYDQSARVEFLEFLRPELRFDSAESLIDQMVLDTQNAKEVLAHAA